MVPRELRDALAAALDPAPDPRPGPGDRRAAVLVPIIVSHPPSIVFTRRAADLSRHPGEISFPGGLVEAGESLEEAALREAREEIDLDPTVPVVVGALSPVHTHVSAILVAPFVGLIDGAPSFSASPGEIDEVLAFPIGRLDEVESTMELARGERVWRGWAYDIDGAFIWGATGAMLHELLEIVRRDASWIL
jgi:8-oxo-dGTP pyrophosphatase MutT (NUDIX family)